MKFNVGDTGDQIEIGQYREVNKSSLKAFFSLIIYSDGNYPKCDKTIDCRYCISGEKRWFMYPQKVEKDKLGAITGYKDYRYFGDSKYTSHLKIAVLEALKHEEANYDKDYSIRGKQSFVSSKPPATRGEEMPF